MSTCSGTTNGLLSQNLTGSGGDSSYACGFLSNYTLASQCCNPEPVNVFSDPCYSWCDLPASMNSEIDNDPDFSMLDYMSACLNATGETIGPLWCRLTQAHVITNHSTTTATTPTSTFDSSAFCATNDPQQLIAVNDPKPACGILPNQMNTLALEACCQGSPVKWTVVHCLEYCYLPYGNEFRGVGNLTYDQTLGSFKTCMLERGNQSETALDGLVCRVNATAIDLKTTTFGTTKYLTGGSGKVGVEVGALAAMVVVLGLLNWL